jgi:sporulation protein YlmC with PRC-barrel domain
MSELEPNRILVRRDKKYGIINLSDETIVPVKYDKFETVNKRTMIAKLNGYYGVIDYDNNTLIFPDCDRIKPFYDTLLLKRYHKYGLATLDGEKLFEPHYDKIKKLGEYILIKKNDKYGVLNSKGEFIEEIIYKKIKLERNRLKGTTDNSNWKYIFPSQN